MIRDRLARYRIQMLLLAPALLGVLLAVWEWQRTTGGAERHEFYIDLALGYLQLGLLLSALAAGLYSWFSYVRRKDEDQWSRHVALIQADAVKKRRNFLKDIGHELRTLIGAVRAGLDNIAVAPPERRDEAWQAANGAYERLRRFVDDLGKIHDLETKAFDFDEVDIAELLLDVEGDIRTRHPTAIERLRLNIQSVPRLPPVLGDWTLLELALRNLVDNAFKYSDADDGLVVSAREDGQYLVIEVVDEGIGIPAEEVEAVWGIGFRGQAAKGRVEGFGLGLTMVRIIIERHGGTVTLQSVVGQWTKVTVRLPIYKAQRG